MYEGILNQYQPNFDRLIEYGFQKEDLNYVLQKPLLDDLVVVFTLTSFEFQIDVYDFDHEKYLPFYVQEGSSSYVGNLRKIISSFVDDIMKHCFDSIDICNQIFLYVKEKYGVIPEHPWTEYPSYSTLKTAGKQKWFGLVMDIPCESLGLKGSGKMFAMNLKNDPSKIQVLIDHQHFFPAYHMNKKHWFTVLLDSHIDMDQLKQFIDESYQMIEKV